MDTKNIWANNSARHIGKNSLITCWHLPNLTSLYRRCFMVINLSTHLEKKREEKNDECQSKTFKSVK